MRTFVIGQNLVVVAEAVFWNLNVGFSVTPTVDEAVPVKLGVTPLMLNVEPDHVSSILK